MVVRLSSVGYLDGRQSGLKRIVIRGTGIKAFEEIPLDGLEG
jgi:hypothetical protein